MQKLLSSGIYSSALLALFALSNQLALAQATCTVNGEEVPCEGAIGGFLGLGIGIFIVMAVVGIAATVFWIMMIVHAASHPIQNKAIWIILMVLTGIIGALVYYFVVKRKFIQPVIEQAPIAAPPAIPPSIPPQQPQA